MSESDVIGLDGGVPDWRFNGHPVAGGSAHFGTERQVLQRDDDLIPTRGVVLFTLTVDAAFIVANETLDIVHTSERWGTLRPAEIVLYVKHVT